MDNIIGREKRDNSLLVQCKSIFYVSSLPNLQNQRTARAQSVSSSPEAVPSDDDVKNHLFLAHPRPDGLLSENEEKSTPNFEVSEPKLSQKSTGKLIQRHKVNIHGLTTPVITHYGTTLYPALSLAKIIRRIC